MIHTVRYLKAGVSGLLFFVLLFLITGSPCVAELLMETHGYVSFAPYVNGAQRTEGLYPGYRADFLAHVDFARWRNVIFTGLVGNRTLISRSQTSIFQLDRIHYTLSPGIRCDFTTWIARASINHESIYSLSRAEEVKGATWENSIRFGVGTKGAYYLYLQEEFKNIGDRFINSIDAQINCGVFLRGSESIWVARNHRYKFEEFSLVRYQIGSFNKWIFFTGVSQNLWIRLNNEYEHKIAVTINSFRKGSVSLFGFYYTYTLYDTYTMDNENRMGALGFRVIF